MGTEIRLALLESRMTVATPDRKCEPTIDPRGNPVGGCGRRLVALPHNTKRKGLIVYVCPECDQLPRKVAA